MRVSAVQRILMALAALLGSLLTGSSAAATTTAEAAAFTYDVQTNERVAVHEFEDVDASTAQLSGAEERSASPSVALRGASTTPPHSVVATNTASGLGDDFTRALDDIDNGLPRPNGRNPKSFGTDGRGSTTRLPDADAGGNPTPRRYFVQKNGRYSRSSQSVMVAVSHSSPEASRRATS